MAEKTVGVYPRSARSARARLFSALERAFPVRFDDTDGLLEPDAAIVVGADDKIVDGLASRGVPVFVVENADLEARTETPVRVTFARASTVDSRLAGRELVERTLPIRQPVRARNGDVVLASVGGDVVWTRRVTDAAFVDTVTAGAVEVSSDEVLWHHMRGERFLALLPLVHFLRAVTADVAWTPPPLRATFVIDDPNLHWRSYGYVDYRKLAVDARERGYHVSIAMVPADMWYAHPEALRIFRDNPDHLSLVVHGVYHLKHELRRPISEEEIPRYIARALSTARRFERTHGVPVSPIMVPPHGRISDIMLGGVQRGGFEALSISRNPHPHRTSPEASDLLAGWNIATMVGGGLPVVLREALPACLPSGDPAIRQDQVLRAYLDQPLVFSGHHADLRDGLGGLQDLVSYAGGLGPVRWMSLEGITRSNFMTRRDGSVLHVRLFTRHARIEIPEGVEEVRIEKAPCYPHSDREIVISNGERRPSLLDGVAMSISGVHTRTLDISLVHPDRVDLGRLNRLPFLPTAMARRLLCEARDRVRTLFRV